MLWWNRNFKVMPRSFGFSEESLNNHVGNFKSIIQRSDREPVFGSKGLGLNLASAAYHLYVLGHKGNSIRTRKMEAAPVAWPTAQIET